MLRLAADENFNRDIIRGLLRRRPELDIVRAQDAGLSGADDPTILEWSSREERVLLSHDVRTITKFAYERLARGEPMPGDSSESPTYPAVPLPPRFAHNSHRGRHFGKTF